jgi:hypothetical protein
MVDHWLLPPFDVICVPFTNSVVALMLLPLNVEYVRARVLIEETSDVDAVTVE